MKSPDLCAKIELQIIKWNIYGSVLMKIPTPQYVVLHNGTADRPAEQKLRLSDAFIQPVNGSEFEWTATMININAGKNDELLEACPALRDYMTLVNRIRENRGQGNDVEDAIDKAVVSCIEDDVLKEFLLKHRTEVLDVCITEFNKDVYEEGIRAEGMLFMLYSLVKDGFLSVKEAAARSNQTEDSFLAGMQANG